MLQSSIGFYHDVFGPQDNHGISMTQYRTLDDNYYYALFHTLSPQGNTDSCEPPHLKDSVCFKVENCTEYYQLLPHTLGYFYTLAYLLVYSNNFLSYTAQSWRQIDCIITVLRRLWQKTTGHIQLPKSAVQCITCCKWNNFCLINKY